jgi:serine/threonine protein kinase
MSDDERPWSPPRFSEPADHPSDRNVPLPELHTSFRYNATSPVLSAWKHFALFLSLASEIASDLMVDDDPAFTNFLRNLRDHDVGLFSGATDYIGRGLTFAVRRSTMSEHRPVIFKSTVPDKDYRSSDLEANRLSAILLELRVLTHAPLRYHPNIVTLLQVGWEGDSFDGFQKWPVSVVEYAELGTLVDFFDHKPSTPFAHRKTICQDITNGLLALHECQVVHGDLKLLNVLMFAGVEEQPFIAKLSDFGGALLDMPDMIPLQSGTPPWNAPGGASNRPRDELLKSDVYSLGLVIWGVMLKGKSPFDDRELFQLPDPRIEEQKWLNAVEAEKSHDWVFIEKANLSIEQVGDVDRQLMSNVFDVSIRVSPDVRDINAVAKLLDCSER